MDLVLRLWLALCLRCAFLGGAGAGGINCDLGRLVSRFFLFPTMVFLHNSSLDSLKGNPVASHDGQVEHESDGSVSASRGGVGRRLVVVLRCSVLVVLCCAVLCCA